MTRAEALDRAVTYLRTAKKPNMIVDGSELLSGHVGLFMYGEDEKENQRLSFPLSETNTQIVSSVSVYDRLSFMTLFDKCSDALVADLPDTQETVLYSKAVPAQSFRIPNKLQAAYRSVSYLIQQLSNKNNKPFYDKMFSEIADRVYPKTESPLEAKTAAPASNPITPTLPALPFTAEGEWRTATIYDRLGLIYVLDSIPANKKILRGCIQERPWEKVLIVPEERIFMVIPSVQEGLTLPSSVTLSQFCTEEREEVSIPSSVVFK